MENKKGHFDFEPFRILENPGTRNSAVNDSKNDKVNNAQDDSDLRFSRGFGGKRNSHADAQDDSDLHFSRDDGDIDSSSYGRFDDSAQRDGDFDSSTYNKPYNYSQRDGDLDSSTYDKPYGSGQRDSDLESSQYDKPNDYLQRDSDLVSSQYDKSEGSGQRDEDLDSSQYDKPNDYSQRDEDLDFRPYSSSSDASATTLSEYSSWQPILQPKASSDQSGADNMKFDRIFAPSEANYSSSEIRHAQQPAPFNFYKENIKKKTNKKQSSAWKYVLVSFLGAALGGTFAFFGATYLVFNTNFFQMNVPQTTKSEPANVVMKYEFDVIDSPVRAIYEKVSPSIVGIRVVSTYNTFFFGEQNITGEGSGIIIRPDGYILTNNHVITGDSSSFGQFPGGGGGSQNTASAYRIEVILPDDKTTSHPAAIIGRDSQTDLAVLKINLTDLPAAQLGDSDLLKPGELAVAIGNPGGLEYMSSVTDGIISGLNRNVRTEDGREYNLIQTNAALNTGNSGGALVNSKGEVIGINTIKVFQTGYEGLGFAIPINAAKEVAENLIDFNYVRGRPKIGIKYNTEFNENYEYFQKQYNVPKGVLVLEVEPLSGAFKAGVLPGDIITKFNNVVIEEHNLLIEIKDSLKPGDIVPIEVHREGKTLSMELELSEDIGDFVQN